MTKDEIVDEVISLLRDHKAGRRGSIHQDPYKHDFFRLFATAYNAGMMKSGSPDFLRADALTEMIATRAPELVEGEVWQGLYRRPPAPKVGATPTQPERPLNRAAPECESHHA